jgi:hypothetical protein
MAERSSPILRASTVVLIIAALAAVTLAESSARHFSEWTHDHSSDGVPRRPSGLSGIVDTYGQPCNGRANDARTYWPHQSAVDDAGYVYSHSYIGRNVGFNVRNHIEAAHNNNALYPLIGSYNCRYIAGTTSWSTHAWGAAVDTNSQRNPVGQDHWNGRGANGTNYGTYIPDVWRGGYPGHRFFWGLNWPTRPDPMHFQYATDY